jgi:predicted transcriptional regulator
MVSTGFKLEQLFGSKTRARLLALLLQYPDEAFFVRELTRKIDAQLNSVRRELQNLVELGLVEEREGATGPTLAEKKKYYGVNKKSIIFEDLRALFQKIQVLLKNKFVQELDQKGEVEYFIFTGSFINKTEVPTDILLIGDIEEKSLSKMIQGFEKELGHEINFTHMAKEEFLYRRQVSDRFLGSILDNDNIVMIDRLQV